MDSKDSEDSDGIPKIQIFLERFRYFKSTSKIPEKFKQNDTRSKYALLKVAKNNASIGVRFRRSLKVSILPGGPISDERNRRVDVIFGVKQMLKY